MKQLFSYFIILIFFLNWSCAPSSKNEEATKKAEPAKMVKTVKKVKQSKSKSTLIRAAVLIDDQWGFIDQEGNPLTNEGFSYADNFSCGLACVSKEGVRMENTTFGGHYYFIDKDGKPSDFGFDEPVRFYEDRAIVPLGNKKAIIDKSGNVIRSGFKKVGHFAGGLAPASKGNLAGYVKPNGSWAFQVNKSLQLDGFSENLARAKKGSKVGFLNTSGDWAIPATWDNAFAFSEKLAAVVEQGKYGFIDPKGKTVIPLSYDHAGNFSDGLCPVLKGNKWGFIDKKGNTVVDFKYDGCRNFKNGYAMILVGKKVGYINTKGDQIVEPKFAGGFDFENGLAIVESNKKMGFINTKGVLVIPPTYARLNNFVDINDTNPIFRY